MIYNDCYSINISNGAKIQKNAECRMQNVKLNQKLGVKSIYFYGF